MTDHERKAIGERIGNYRLVQQVGSGGFADVYLGEHQHLGTHAAIKVLHTKLTDEQIELFRLEARTLAHLLHPHIVRVLDFDVENQFPFLVMDYAPGGTLSQRHPRGTIVPFSLAIGYLRQIASALDYAHDQKLIHRDVKPENMLIDRQGQIMLSDFGIASIVQSSNSQTLAEMAGTITYIAPEQIEGRPHLASDQYALGVILYEWLSGERLFQGSVTEIVSQHLAASPPSLHGRIPGISPTVENVIFTALEKNPRDRFASVQAFVRALEQAARDGSTVVPYVPSTIGTYDVHEDITQPSRPSAPTDEASVSPAQMASSALPDPSLMAPSTPPIAEPIPSVQQQLPLLAYLSAASHTRRKLLVAGSIIFLLLLLIASNTLYMLTHTRALSPHVVHSTPVTVTRTIGLVATAPQSTRTPSTGTTSTIVSIIKATPTPLPSTISKPVPTPAPTSLLIPTPEPTSMPTPEPAPTPAPTPTPEPTPTPTPTCPAQIQYGSVGTEVKMLQNALNNHSFPDAPYTYTRPLAVDGQFGPQVQAAVKDFQTAHGLQVDGQVGPLTWQALGYC